eukprot:768607-Hanusia_phi.AAC.5
MWGTGVVKIGWCSDLEKDQRIKNGRVDRMRKITRPFIGRLEGSSSPNGWSKDEEGGREPRTEIVGVEIHEVGVGVHLRRMNVGVGANEFSHRGGWFDPW